MLVSSKNKNEGKKYLCPNDHTSFGAIFVVAAFPFSPCPFILTTFFIVVGFDGGWWWVVEGYSGWVVVPDLGLKRLGGLS